ncbi:MAG: efflux RND transporter periplasmic adaptor subunit [Desulfobacteraceae bacterium]|nr:efflux RND transporter periplasmic adaptor subunit [Desulfobacteraceae bacterium]
MGKFFFLVMALALSFSGCGERVEPGVDKKNQQNRIRTVSVSHVDATPPQGNVEYVGVLVAQRKVRVFSELGGTIERLLFEKGDRVREGNLLAEVSTTSFRLKVRQAKAARRAAESEIEKLERGSRPQEIQIARAALEESEAALFEAEKDFERIEGLYKIRAVSKREYDTAVRKLNTVNARLDSAQQQLVLALQGPRVEDIKKARANLDQAEAALALAKDQVKKSRLHAPCDGIIAFRDVEVAEVIPPGTPITQVIDLNRLKIKVSMGEKDIHILRNHKRFPFTIDALPNEKFRCRLTFLAPAADPVTRSFPLELMVEETDPRMADGMTVRIKFPAADNKKTLKVPSAWLSEEDGKIGLYIVEGGKALFKETVLGSYYDQRVEILSGLSDRDRVIINPAGLKSGDPVRVGQ